MKKYNRLFQVYQQRLAEGDELSHSDISTILSDIEMLEHGYKKTNVQETVDMGLQVLNSYLARKLGLDLSSDYETVARTALMTGYFEGASKDNPELKAIVEISMRKFRGESSIPVDYSKLVNRD